MLEIDEKDAQILNILQKNCRTSFTQISEEIGISIDTTKKRYEKLLQNKVFNPKIQIRPRAIGYPLIVDVKIKFSTYSEKKLNEFIKFCYEHSHISEVFETSGNWDCTIVIFAKNHLDLGFISKSIREKFSEVIGDWTEALTTTGHKFEDYDIQKLLEEVKNEQ